MTTHVVSAIETIRDAVGDISPKIGIILGSGLGGLAACLTEATRISYEDLPGFPQSTVPSHSGALIIGNLGSVPVALLSGRSHYYEHGIADAMRLPIEVLAALGCTTLVLSNAAGSTRGELVPGTLMLIIDHINWSGRNPLIGSKGATGFIDMSVPYDPALCDMMRDAAIEQDIALAEGVYAWFSGPSFETPAEIRMVAMLGADAVGMSTVPETILGKAMGMQVVGVSLITNLGSGIGEGALNHEAVQTEGKKAADDFEALIQGFVVRAGT